MVIPSARKGNAIRAEAAEEGQHKRDDPLKLPDHGARHQESQRHRDHGVEREEIEDGEITDAAARRTGVEPSIGRTRQDRDRRQLDQDGEDEGESAYEGELLQRSLTLREVF
jgi:hypothetical protein